MRKTGEHGAPPEEDASADGFRALSSPEMLAHPASKTPKRSSNSMGVETFPLELPASKLHPIGVHAAGAENIDVYQVPATGLLDVDWLEAHFPFNVSELSNLLAKGFEQYCGNDWCGAEMRDEVLAELADGSMYPPQERLHSSGRRDMCHSSRFSRFSCVPRLMRCS